MARVELVRNERLSVVDGGRREEEEGEKAQADVKREGSRLIPCLSRKGAAIHRLALPRLASPRASLADSRAPALARWAAPASSRELLPALHELATMGR